MLRSQPMVGPQDGTCSNKSNQTWGVTNPLHWNTHQDGAECVLELQYGTIPDIGRQSDGTGSPVPWRDSTVTKLVIDAPGPNGPVKLISGWGLFDGNYLPNLKTVDVANLDTSQATLMGYMFFTNTKLTKLDLNTWDTSRVTDFTWMFNGDSNLTTLGVPGLKIPSGTTQTAMFDGCAKLVRCAQPGDHTWTGGGNTVIWNEHLVDNGDNTTDCVLEIKSGVIPDFGYQGNGTGSVKWRDSTVTKLVVDPPAPGQPKVKMKDGWGLFDGYNLPNMRTADVGNLDTSGATNFGWLFGECPNLETITGLENWDTSSALDMQNMFRVCPKLKQLNLNRNGVHWDTSRVTNMDYMFINDSSLTTIGVPGLAIPTAVHSNTNHMFDGCTKLIRCGNPGERTWGDLHFNEHLSEDGTDCVLELEYGTIPDIGKQSDGITSGSPVPWRDGTVTKLVIDAPDANGPVKLTSGWGLFDGNYLPNLRTADVANLDTSQATLMGFMFYAHTNPLTITGLENWDTSHVTDMSYMFKGSPGITSLNLTHNGNKWDTSHVTDMSYMFQGDSNLTTIGVPGLALHGTTTSMFDGCTKLVRCGNPGEHSWGTTDPLLWNEHLVDNHDGTTDCVLELESGTIPDFGYNGDGRAPIPWKDPTVTRVVADAPGGNKIKMLDGLGLFDNYNLSGLKTADLTNLDTSQAKYLCWMFVNQANLTQITGLESFNTSGATDMKYMFNGCSKLTNLDLSNWDTSKVTDMSYMFFGCTNLISVITSNSTHHWDTSQVTTMDRMFCTDSNLTTVTGIENWDTAKVTDMCGLFYQCYKLPHVDLSPNGNIWNTSHVTDMRWMFTSDGELTSIGIPGFKIPAGAQTGNMFDGCVKLVRCGNPGDHAWTGGGNTVNWNEELAGTLEHSECVLTLVSGTIPNYGHVGDGSAPIPWRDSTVTKLVAKTPDPGQPKVKMLDGFGLFDSYNLPNLKSVELSQLDVSQATDFGYIFWGSPITSIDLSDWDTHSATNMERMFRVCPNLKTLTTTSGTSHWDTSHVTSMDRMFDTLPNLENVDGLGDWNVSSVTDFCGFMYMCPKITNPDIKSWKPGQAIDMSYMFTGDTALVGDPVPSSDAYPTPNGKTLDLSGWDTHSATNMHSIFQGCSSLESLDISGWDMSHLGTGIGNGGKALGNAMMFKYSGLLRLKTGSKANLSVSVDRWYGERCGYPSPSGWNMCSRGNNEDSYSPLWGTDDPNHSDDANHPGNVYTPVASPRYESNDWKWKLVGSTSSNVGAGALPGPTSLYLLTASYNGNGGNISCPDAVPTTAVCKTASRNGFRLTGWNTQANGNGDQYRFGATIPYTIPGNVLYATWQAIKPPTITKATPHADGSLDVSGVMKGGTLGGDTFTTTPYATGTGGAAGNKQDTDAVIDAAASAPDDSAWTARYTNTANPYTNGPTASTDNVGSGASLWFTGKLTQKDHSSSLESTPRTKLTIDTIAPGVEQLKIAGPQTSSAPNVKATIKGVAWTKGATVTRSSRATEAGDRITVTWPDATTSGAKEDGSPLATSDPGSIVSGTDGSFIFDVPAGVPIDGRDATVTVWDNADGDGTDPTHPAGIENKANHADFTVKLTPLTLNKLPFTGQTWKIAGMILLAFAASMAALTGVITQRRRS